MSIMLPDADIHESFSWPPPDSLSAIIVGHGESRLVSKQHHAPLLPCPALMMSAPLHTGLTVSMCKWHTDGSDSASQIMLVQSVADGLLTDVDVGRHSQLCSETFCCKSSVSQSCQPHKPVVVVTCHSGPSRPMALFSAACCLESFLQSLNDGMGHPKPSSHFSARNAIFQPCKSPTTVHF